MKPTAGGFCPLPDRGSVAANQVKRKIHLDATVAKGLSEFSFTFNVLDNKIETAQIQGRSLKPFCNHALNMFHRPSPTDLSTSLVDKSAPPARFLALP